MPPLQPLIVNGWTLLAHEVFLDQLEQLVSEVEAAKARDTAGYKKKNSAKRLAAVNKLVFEVIPQNPEAPEFRQGNTLGKERRHWFRAKFFQQYRLFFRYHTKSKLIIFAWINDEDTKRAYDSRSDAYAIFGKMLDADQPPDGWVKLREEAARERQRFATIAGKEGGVG